MNTTASVADDPERHHVSPITTSSASSPVTTSNQRIIYTTTQLHERCKTACTLTKIKYANSSTNTVFINWTKVYLSVPITFLSIWPLAIQTRNKALTINCIKKDKISRVKLYKNNALSIFSFQAMRDDACMIMNCSNGLNKVLTTWHGIYTTTESCLLSILHKKG